MAYGHIERRKGIFIKAINLHESYLENQSLLL